MARIVKRRVSRVQNVDGLRARVKELEAIEQLLHKSEEADRRFSGQLSALVEMANDLSMAESVDGLCRRAVELGRSRLGFDRIGIWFRTEEPDVIRGSFGVELNGELSDERDKRTRVDPDDPDGRILLSKEPFVLVGEAPLVNSRGEIVGQASEIFAALWDGEKVIGHLSADNRVRHEPLERRQCEVLRLFGAVVGYLYTRKCVEMERQELIGQLQEALARIKTLRGLIPICAGCKKIRDDQGYWQQVEVYVHDHSEADFSHSLCPDCVRRLYPEHTGRALK